MELLIKKTCTTYPEDISPMSLAAAQARLYMIKREPGISPLVDSVLRTLSKRDREMGWCCVPNVLSLSHLSPGHQHSGSSVHNASASCIISYQPYSSTTIQIVLQY